MARGWSCSRIGRRMHSTGFCVPWTVSASDPDGDHARASSAFGRPANGPSMGACLRTMQGSCSVVIAPRQGPTCRPYEFDLRPDPKPAAIRLSATVVASWCVPDIATIAGKQRPGFAPVGAVVVQHRAVRLVVDRPGLVPPARVVFTPYGRIGNHRMRDDAVQQRFSTTGGSLRSPQTMRCFPINHTSPSLVHRINRRPKNIILVRQARLNSPSFRPSNSSSENPVSSMSEVHRGKLAKLKAQRPVVPSGIQRKLVVLRMIGALRSSDGPELHVGLSDEGSACRRQAAGHARR